MATVLSSTGHSDFIFLLHIEGKKKDVCHIAFTLAVVWFRIIISIVGNRTSLLEKCRYFE